ncbi:MAG: hypothetical protein ACI35R_14500 [Bacillus sp. (in: firmicutes)]
MIKAGIVLLVIGFMMTIASTKIFGESAYVEYIQIGGFFLGVIGLFMMETNRRKRMKK